LLLRLCGGLVIVSGAGADQAYQQRYGATKDG
jgi:hypothetical protein